MKKVILFLVTIACTFAQFDTKKLRAHFGIIPETGITMFEFGADYKLLNFNKNVPFYGNFNFSFGSKSPVTTTAIEFGGTAQYFLDQPDLRNLYFSGGVLISIVTASTDDVTTPLGKVDNSHTETKATLNLGTGYKFNKNLFAEIMFAFTGFDNVRFRFGYNF